MTASIPFDYDALPADDADRLRQLASDVHAIGRAQTDQAVKTGEALIDAKERLCHGQFGLWCHLEAGFQPRTVQLLIKLAYLARDEPDVRGLHVSAAYHLAKPSTPVEVIAQVLSSLRRGERVTVAWVESLIRDAKSKVTKPDRARARNDAFKIAEMIATALMPAQAAQLRKFLDGAGAASIKTFVAELRTRLPDEIGETGFAESFASEQAQQHLTAL